VACQLHIALNMMMNNVYKAFTPQIVMSYARKDFSFFDSLIFRASRLSFFLVTLVSAPVILCMNEILSLWLTDVPEYSVIFTQLTVLFCIVESLSGPLRTANQAYGKVWKYMLTVALLSLSIIPVGLLLLRHGFDPVSILVVRLIIGAILLLFRIFYIRITMDFPIREYFSRVGSRVLVIMVLLSCLYILLDRIIVLCGFPKMIVSGGTMFMLTLVSGFFILLNRNERLLIENKLLNLWRR
ncbi:MAG: hypothetical protein K2H85_11175, partial [Allobaculum sp.]|nr:hypothetical protein [Allobaculum sp.]